MKGQKLCGARTRAGTPCKKTAGWGTDHVGIGKCKLHGGSSTGPRPESMKGNKNAETHGLFSKYLPEETKEIVDAIENVSPIEILWQNIKIQFAAILRSQQIMEVKSRDDLIKLERKYTDNELGESFEYEYQTAWDRQERFLTSQARAMTSLTNMLIKYEDMCSSELVTEEQKLRAEKLRLEAQKIKEEINKLKGISEEIEDLDEINDLIYEEEKDNSI